MKDRIETLYKIAQRAVDQKLTEDVLSTEMDIDFTDKVCPLMLNDLLTADNFNFAHDILGITRHFNRVTKQLDNCFLPRFAK